MIETNENIPDLVPAWLLPLHDDGQSTSITHIPDLKIGLSIPEDWPRQPKLLPSRMQSDAIFRGNKDTEFLVISFMPNAVPGHDMRQWLGFSLQMTGFPEMRIVEAFENLPRLIWWPEIVSSLELAKRMEVDEAHRNTGQALINGEAVRLFVLLLRKDRLAWKIFLSIPSGWDKHEDVLNILFDDYSFAGKIFSSIKTGNREI